MQTESSGRRRGPLRLVAALVALALMLLMFCQYFGNFFYPYWTAYSVQQQGYKADVVFVGPSHVFTDIIPQKLYDDVGLAACNVSAASAGMRNVYWGARESIDAMHPSLICVDLMAMIDPQDPENVNLIEELPLTSPNRFLALRQAGAGLADWGEYVRFLFSHGQYENLDRENFDSANYRSTFALALGYEQSDRVMELTAEDEPHWTEDTPYQPLELDPENVENYRKLADYAQQKGVDVLWYISVDPRADRQDGYRTVADLLAQDGRTLLNCNAEEIKQALGYDITTDMRDDHHMNYVGAAKFTAWMGEYLTNHYSLPERRGAAGYELWQQHPYSYVALAAADSLADCDDLNEYLLLLHRLGPDYTVAAIGWGEWTLTDEQRGLLQQDWTGGQELPPDNVHFLCLSGRGTLQLSAADSALPDAAPAPAIRTNLDGTAFELTDGERGMSLTLNREEVLPSVNGFSLTVYSTLTHKVVDSVRFSPTEPVVHGE